MTLFIIENSTRLFLLLLIIASACAAFVVYFIVKGLENARKNNEAFYFEAQIFIMDELKFTTQDEALFYYMIQRFDRGRQAVTLRVYTCDINGKKCDYVGEGWAYFKGIYGNENMNESKTI